MVLGTGHSLPSGPGQPHMGFCYLLGVEIPEFSSHLEAMKEPVSILGFPGTSFLYVFPSPPCYSVNKRGSSYVGGIPPRPSLDLDTQQLSLHKFLWGTFVPPRREGIAGLLHMPSSSCVFSTKDLCSCGLSGRCTRSPQHHFIFHFLVVPCAIWDLSSPAREPTGAPWAGSLEA